jgi:hypothetical protein
MQPCSNNEKKIFGVLPFSGNIHFHLPLHYSAGQFVFKKEFAVSRHQPFGKTSDYVKCIENADLSKIGKLVKLVGMLRQTKVYLFWSLT